MGRGQKNHPFPYFYSFFKVACLAVFFPFPYLSPPQKVPLPPKKVLSYVLLLTYFLGGRVYRVGCPQVLGKQLKVQIFSLFLGGGHLTDSHMEKENSFAPFFLRLQRKRGNKVH